MRGFLTLGLVCTALWSSSAFAMRASGSLSEIKYAGSGCPKGSVSINMTPNKRSINAVFDHFFTALNHQPKQSIKRCKLSIQLKVSRQQRVRLRQVRFRGFVDLPLAAQAKMVRNYRFANETKQLVTHWQGRSFQIINRREAFNSSWSQCGEVVTLGVDSMIELKSRAAVPSLIGVDSFDQLLKQDYRGERGWKFILEYSTC